MSQLNQRPVHFVMQSQNTSDGDGVKIRRVAGFNNKNFSPFLMVDELKADDKKDYVGGFPPHPHRGIETLTYMMNGHFQHKDHMGNVGELRSGGAPTAHSSLKGAFITAAYIALTYTTALLFSFFEQVN